MGEEGRTPERSVAELRGRARRRTTILFVTLLLAQVAIPAAMLLRPRPAYFGWQMFTALQEVGSWSVVTIDGAVRPVLLDERIVRPRAEIRLQAHLPRHLCRTVPDALAVVGTGLAGTDSLRFPCR